QTAYCIDVGGSANLVMTKDPGSKEYFDRSRFITPSLPRELLQHALQFARQGGRHKRVLRGRGNAIRPSRRHRDQHCIFLSSPFDISVSGVVPKAAQNSAANLGDRCPRHLDAARVVVSEDRTER